MKSLQKIGNRSIAAKKRLKNSRENKLVYRGLSLKLRSKIGIFTVIEDPHGNISTIFSFIPFTSPVVMLMRIPFGVPIWQQIVSFLLLIGTFMFTVWFAAKIYRVGILMYGKKISFRELGKWLMYKS